MDNIKAKHYIEYTKDGITDKFYEGDKVICRTADEEYTGKITCVGEFKENEEAEPVTVICLDTSKSVWSYSSEIIKFDDIEFIVRRHIVVGANCILFSVYRPTRLCRIGTYRRF